MASAARRSALALLGRVEKGEALAPPLERAAAALTDARDRALLHELVLGTLRRRGWLDHVLTRLSRRSFDALAPAVRDALRLGAYQLLFLRTPAHAAVSEAVDLAREREPHAGPFVNAILRRLQREGPPPEPDPSADPVGWMSTAGSLPRWLAERWHARLGPGGALARTRAALDLPPTFVRLNPRVPSARDELAAAGIELEPTAVPEAFRASAGALGRFAESGLVYVQDAGSQLVARLAAAEGLLLDACAAPGGKAMLLSDMAQGPTRVVAAEASRKRLALMTTLARRWGATRLLLLGADALSPPFRSEFDGVLLDAPCSGLGTLARNPDIRWRVRPADIERHAARQRALLASLARLVRPGGHLVYAACSLEAEETHQVVDAFLAANAGFAQDELPEWSRLLARDGRVELDPALQAGDGFFAVRLRRVSAAVVIT
jgi:16S rRNA (cytosine967-C5)-methyltransferase